MTRRSPKSVALVPAITRVALLCLALAACELAIGNQSLESVSCSDNGAIGPPACPSGQLCAGDKCTPCAAEEDCSDQLDNDCRGGVNDTCGASGSAGKGGVGGAAGHDASVGGAGSGAGGVAGTGGAPGLCTPGATRTDDCGNCGKAQVQCTNEGVWGAPGPCTGEGECAKGKVSDPELCGDKCGTQTRTCDDNCHWGAYSACVEGTCKVGSTEEKAEACGNCGTTMKRTCDGKCNWSPWFCADTKECAPGQREKEDPWNSKCTIYVYFRVCSDACVWSPWTCVDAGCKTLSNCTADHECCSAHCGSNGYCTSWGG